jgi:hypothetical protein
VIQEKRNNKKGERDSRSHPSANPFPITGSSEITSWNFENDSDEHLSIVCSFGRFVSTFSSSTNLKGTMA